MAHVTGRSQARREAEEYAGVVVGRMVMDGGEHGVRDILETVADAYERGRTAPVRGRLLERVARAHYERVSLRVGQAVPWDRLEPVERREILDAVRELLDRTVLEASTPETKENT